MTRPPALAGTNPSRADIAHQLERFYRRAGARRDNGHRPAHVTSARAAGMVGRALLTD
jgi:hypothetical protein